MTTYDRADWHNDAAVQAGQPPENAFTHIGLYLGWLIRNDLHDESIFPAGHVAAVKRGAMTGSDLADDVDGKLLPDLVTVDGQAFSDANYQRYVEAYNSLFPGVADYGVPDDDASYAAVARLLDGLYFGWVAAGRPGPDGATVPERHLGSSEVIPMNLSDDRRGNLRRFERTDAREFERLIPVNLTKPPMQVRSMPASQWGSSLLNQSLKRLGTAPNDVAVVHAMGGSGRAVLMLAIYGLAGIPADVLLAEFTVAVHVPPEARWERRVIAKRKVRWAETREFTVALWAQDGVVFHAVGEPEVVKAAVQRLP